MKWNIIFLLTLIIATAQAQTPPDPEQNLRALGNLTPASPGAIGFDNRYEGVKGNPYLFDDYKLGSILFAKQDTFSTPVEINVDLITQTLLAKLKNGYFGQISATNVQAIKVVDDNGGHSHHYLVEREGDVEGIRSVRMKFYEELHHGNFSFLKSVEKRFQKANFTGAYSVDKRSDEFVTEITYWLKTPEKPYQKVTIRRKDIEKALDEYDHQVDEITKNNKLNLNKEEDIAQLLALLEEKQK